MQVFSFERSNQAKSTFLLEGRQFDKCSGYIKAFYLRSHHLQNSFPKQSLQIQIKIFDFGT